VVFMAVTGQVVVMAVTGQVVFIPLNNIKWVAFIMELVFAAQDRLNL
jgi:hypothetical protein